MLGDLQHLLLSEEENALLFFHRGSVFEFFVSAASAIKESQFQRLNETQESPGTKRSIFRMLSLLLPCQQRSCSILPQSPSTGYCRWNCASLEPLRCGLPLKRYIIYAALRDLAMYVLFGVQQASTYPSMIFPSDFRVFKFMYQFSICVESEMLSTHQSQQRQYGSGSSCSILPREELQRSTATPNLLQSFYHLQQESEGTSSRLM